MKRKAKIEDNMTMLSCVKKIARRENNDALLNWANGAYAALNWIIDNGNDSNIATSLCTPSEESEVKDFMNKMNWED